MNFLYWLELMVIIYFIRKHKVTAEKLLKIAWWGTVVGAVLFSELVLRIFFVFWIVGIVVTLIELRNEQK
jgi:hypothetical protein